jgi:C1A family cysteine protease
MKFAIVTSLVLEGAAVRQAVDPALVARVNNNPLATWVAGYGRGRFANATLDQASLLLGARKPAVRPTEEEVFDGVAVPDSYDIREKFGQCASVKAINDQGSCGGCWAFAVAESLGDRFCIAGQDVELSAQNLLDCDHAGMCSGCNGGLTEDAFDYINDNGILSASCVPWTGGDSVCTDSKCAAAGADSKRYFSSWAKYVSSDEAKIKEELFQQGSITAAFEVFHDFFSYESGVYSHLEGDYAGLHAVNLMGWGTDNGVDYWLVKNSWGPDFGEQGFFRIKRGLQNNGCNFEGGLTSATATLGQLELV